MLVFRRLLGTVNRTSLNSFNANHALYDKVRPNFQNNQTFLKSFIFEDSLPRDVSNPHILELAAGTGKFTKALLQSLSDNSLNPRLSIVEPSEGMLDSFKANMSLKKDLQIFQGSSYSIPLEDNSVDAVFVAQGYHWFSDLSSLKEIHRVLNKAHGTLNLIWNYDTAGHAQIIPNEYTEVKLFYSSEDLANFGKICLESISDQGKNGLLRDQRKKYFKLSELICSKLTGWDCISNYIYTYDLAVPQYRTGKWRDSLENQKYFNVSSSVEGFNFDIDLIDVDTVFDYWESRSYITSLPHTEKDIVKHKLQSLIKSLPSFNLSEDRKMIKRFISSHYVSLPISK